jgi:hypothetical protein
MWELWKTGIEKAALLYIWFQRLPEKHTAHDLPKSVPSHWRHERTNRGISTLRLIKEMRAVQAFHMYGFGLTRSTCFFYCSVAR